MVPYKREFAAIDIPILQISGYSGADSVSDYFLPEHARYSPKAQHYLVIGPYGHGDAQSNFKSPVLDGYPIDPIAQFDTLALTFQWFNYVMKGGPSRPWSRSGSISKSWARMSGATPLRPPG
jgi:predicted acyl esterase